MVGAPKECYVGYNFVDYKRFVLARKILLDPCFVCEPLAVIYEYFTYAYPLLVAYVPRYIG